MPAPIVVVHDDAVVLRDYSAALRGAGFEVAEFTNFMKALLALEHSGRARLLIARFNSPPGQPNGVSLARMVRRQISDVKILFVGEAENERHGDGMGAFLPTPATAHQVLETARALLG